jgi:peptide-methionine (S)-S-oxide reductase
MKLIILVISFLSAINLNAQTIGKIPVGSTKNPSADEKVATFGEGCFWHAEIVFQSLVGVRDAVSGYAGGRDTRPNYEKVASEKNRTRRSGSSIL